MIRGSWGLGLALLLVLGGCATTDTEMQPSEGTGEAQEADSGEAAEAEGAGEGEQADPTAAPDCPPNCDFRRSAVEDEASALAERTIYFAFDSSKVRQDHMPIVKRHAAYLTQYGDVEVRLEGHTDERGSREYNVGLGARRADSVAQLLQAYGVSQTQIETVSYGEEVPAVEGHNEQAWAKNRRVELVYPSASPEGGDDAQ
jgi:peptidoglycan-associated lipoprotein